MRALLLVLVLGNILVFALESGLLGMNRQEPDRPSPQALSPDRIRLVSRGEAPPVLKPPPPPKDCRVWEALSESQAGAVAEQVDRLRAGSGEVRWSLSREATTREVPRYWVIIPPSGEAGAARKAAELKKLGISDFFIVTTEGPDPTAISLGVFATREQADAALDRLRVKGVRSAQVDARTGREPAVRVQLSGPADQLATVSVKVGVPEGLRCPEGEHPPAQ